MYVHILHRFSQRLRGHNSSTLHANLEHLEVKYRTPEKYFRISSPQKSGTFFRFAIFHVKVFWTKMKMNWLLPARHNEDQCKAQLKNVVQNTYKWNIVILKKWQNPDIIRNLVFFFIPDIPLISAPDWLAKWFEFFTPGAVRICVNTWTKKVNSLCMTVQNT
jgi:hypothetical protein